MKLFHDKGLGQLFLMAAGLACILPFLNLYLIYPRYQDQMMRSVQREARRVAHHLARRATVDSGRLQIDFDQEAEPFILADFALLKVKVFDQGGTVVYSSEASDVGSVNSHDYFHAVVALGQEFSKVVAKATKTMEGETISRDVVETYVPIMQDTTFVGAFELYYDISDHKQEFNRIYLTSLFYPLPIMLVFICLVGVILKRLDTKNAEQRRDRQEIETQHNTLLAEQEKQRELLKNIEKAKRQWEITMDCIDDMVIMVEDDFRVKRCNLAVLTFCGQSFAEVLGQRLPDLFSGLFMDPDHSEWKSLDYFHERTGRWFSVATYATSLSADSNGLVVTLHDMTEVKQISSELEKKNQEISAASRELQRAIDNISAKNQDLESAYSELKLAQSHLLQQEKMASIGQLAAGVAHEINNPVGFISSNLSSLHKYKERLAEYIRLGDELLVLAGNQELCARLAEANKKGKIGFIIADIDDLIRESLDGCERVKKIVQDLKSFSRVDQATRQTVDIHECLDSTINIVWNELKYKAKIVKDYQATTPVACFPQQLNQVFMNLLINAAHAIDKEGVITIKTWQDATSLSIAIGDNGCGIAPEHVNRIFEPFFTTKEVGKGTGLGLSIVYDIVAKNHGGDILVDSECGRGTTFTVKIPLGGEPH